MSLSELKAAGFLLDYPNKVFREVLRQREFLIEAATPAIALIIKRNIKDMRGVRALAESLFAEGDK